MASRMNAVIAVHAPTERASFELLDLSATEPADSYICSPQFILLMSKKAPSTDIMAVAIHAYKISV